jgi:hypothetical protein
MSESVRLSATVDKPDRGRGTGKTEASLPGAEPRTIGTQPARPLSSDRILMLQRTHGNGFVQRLLGVHPAGAPPRLQRDFIWTEGAIEQDPSNTGGTFEPYRNLIAAVRRYNPAAEDRGASALKDIIFWGRRHIARHWRESRTAVVKRVVADAEQEIDRSVEPDRQLKLDELGARLAKLSSTLDTSIQLLLHEAIGRAKRAKFGTSEARDLTIYAEEAESRLSSLESRGQLNDETVRVGNKRTVVIKPIYVATTTFPELVSQSVWQSQFADCRRVWAGLGVSFQEEQSDEVWLDDSTEAGDLLSHDGVLRTGKRFTKGAAIDRFNDLMAPYKPTGNVLPVFILPTKLLAEQTDGITLNARTIFIAGNQASVNVLAHEMSHVLGIDHPIYEDEDYHSHPGEKGSVADPSGGKGFESTIGHSTKTNPLSHYGLMESYETTEKPERIKKLLEDAGLELPYIREQFHQAIARGSTNASKVKVFSDLQWTSEAAKAKAVALGTQINEISAQINRLKTGDVRPEELGIAFPVRVIVENSPIVIFGHD